MNGRTMSTTVRNSCAMRSTTVERLANENGISIHVVCEIVREREIEVAFTRLFTKIFEFEYSDSVELNR